MIKAVLFDYGGVLSEGGKAGAIRQIFAKAYNLDPDKLRFEDIGLEALKGLVSDQAFLDNMNRNHPQGTPVSVGQFVATVDHLKPCQQVVGLAAALRTHGIATGILSNILRLAADELRNRGCYDHFDPLLLSCDEHMAKPEKEFYELALERLGLKPEEIVFVDDQAVFLEPAASLGMHTVLATSPEQIVDDVRQLLQKENNLTLA